MKKIVALVVMLTLLFSLTGCSNRNEPILDENWKPDNTFEFALDNEEEQAYSEKITFDGTTDLEYDVTWTPSGLSVAIVLEAEDGTRQVKDLDGGRVQGSFGTIPARTYRVLICNTSSLEKFPKADLRRVIGTAGFRLQNSTD